MGQAAPMKGSGFSAVQLFKSGHTMAGAIAHCPPVQVKVLRHETRG
jgi:hypothetical protein